MPPDLHERYQLDRYIDTFALGHYARVLSALDHQRAQTVAFKVMRPEHLDPDTPRWEYRAFPHEAELLTALADSPHVVGMTDCGYLESRDEVPYGGQIVSFGTDAAAFSAAMPDYAARGWRPYIALDNLPRTHNLLYLMKTNQAGVRWRLPTEEGLALALQFAHLLQLAHAQRVVYMDHKLEHVYWDGARLRIIDFNSSRRLSGSGPEASDAIRKDVHHLCVGILYPVFTGLSAGHSALRAQPGGLNEVEGRYSEVMTLDFGAEPSLSSALQALLQSGAAMQIESADAFIAGLEDVAALHGWDFPAKAANASSRQARDHVRSGLALTRQGQDALREARDLFREAAILDDITPDMEAELRRLVKAINDMLNQRVIP